MLEVKNYLLYKKVNLVKRYVFTIRIFKSHYLFKAQLKFLALKNIYLDKNTPKKIINCLMFYPYLNKNYFSY